MERQKTLIFLAGLLSGIMLIVATGFTNLGTVTATISQVRYLVLGKEVKASDQPQHYFNGQAYVPASLNYAGTTYVPFRFAAEMLGYRVDWDDNTGTISISEPAQTGEPVYPRTVPMTPMLKGEAPQEVVDLLNCSVATELAQSYTLGEKTYLIVTRGSKPTGGYGVQIEEVTETQTEVIVKVRYDDPAPDDEVTQAITYPNIIGMVEKLTKPVRFVGAGDHYIPELYGISHMESIVAESPGIKLFAPQTALSIPTVRGVARVFEGTVSWQLTDGTGKQMDKGFVTADSGGPNWGYFKFQIPANFLQGTISLQVYEESAEDGRPVNVVSIPLDKYVGLAIETK